MADPLRLTVAKILGMAGVTVLGFGLVVVGVVVMNRISHAPEENEISQAVSFSLPPPPPPPPAERREPPPRQQRRSNQPNLAPLPSLGSNLSGIAVSLPGFDADVNQDVSETLLGDLDNVALTEDAVDDPPAFRTRIVPEYPERARQRDLEGRVVLSALIGVDGRVQTVQVLESNPPGIFDQAAIAALQASSFEPARYRGNPVETWVEIPFPFRLN